MGQICLPTGCFYTLYKLYMHPIIQQIRHTNKSLICVCMEGFLLSYKWIEHDIVLSQTEDILGKADGQTYKLNERQSALI